MKRLLNFLKAIWNKFFDTIEDPEMMIDLARREMQELLMKNKERAVQAVTQRNRLQMMVNQTESQIKQNEAQATRALQMGNEEMAKAFMREQIVNKATLEQLLKALDQADKIVEQVKVAIKNQEAECRKKAAEALALKAQWKGAQVQNAIMKALDGMSFENPLEGYGAAKEKIDNMSAEASARSEMFAESFAGKTMVLENDAADIEAEAALDDLRSRLGMSPATTSAPVAPAVVSAAGDADVALRQLEQRLTTPAT